MVLAGEVLLHFQYMVVGEEEMRKQSASGHTVTENIYWFFVGWLNECHNLLGVKAHNMQHTVKHLETTIREMEELRQGDHKSAQSLL